MYSKFMNMFKLYKKNADGNIAIIFVISSLVILLVVSVAINSTQLFSTKQKLTDAADVAVLAAVKAVSDEIEVLELGDWESIGQSVGQELFESKIKDIDGIGEVDYNLVLTLGSNAREVFGELTFSTLGATFLPSMLGRDKIVVSNKVSATKTLYKYARINFLIDVSSSMAIGADTENQDLLHSATGCAIACHKNGTLKVARDNGITLRLDTIKDALKAMISNLKNAEGANREFTVAIYTFSNSVEEHQAETHSLEDAIAAVDSIEIASSVGQSGTNIQHSLAQLNSMIPAGKGGTRQRFRQSYVIIMTDGVENSVQYDGIDFVRDPNFYTTSPAIVHTAREQIQGFNPSVCDDLKDNKHTVAFLNPTYLLPSERGQAKHREKFGFIEDELISDIESHSKDCSTSSKFAYSAEKEAEVERASIELFNDLLGRAPRLSE